MKMILLVILFAFSNIICSGQKRVALVIGNANYSETSLRNPLNDATDIATTLRGLGFTVTLKTNLNKRGMETAVRAFNASLAFQDIALFYYSGHGMQVNGSNYLIPVGEIIRSEIDVRYNAMETQYVMDNLRDAGTSVNIIILDACRDNPFRGVRSQTKGFVAVSAPQGTFIAYSTAPKTVAYDGTERNSPYTKNLLTCIKKPGVQIEDAFKEVRRIVMKETSEKQVPWESSSLIHDFFFNPIQDQINQSNPPQYVPVTTSNTIKPVEKETKEKPQPSNEFSSQAGTFTDSRDGQEYKWVRIGDQVWMAQNLNVGTKVSSGNKQKDNGYIEKYCLKRDSYNCKIYGGFYTWDEMMQYSYRNDNQGICPQGWHIPSDKEWIELEFFVENDAYKSPQYFQQYGWRGSSSGKRLKSEKLWKKNSNNVDDFNFCILPSGCPTVGGFPGPGGGYKKLGENAFFWTCSLDEKKPKRNSIIRRLSFKHDGVLRTPWPKEELVNVRCIKDDQVNNKK